MASDRSSLPDVQLNLNIRGMQLSATLGINERCAQLLREGRRVYRLGLGQSPFPVPECVVEALRRNAHQKDYLPVRGLGELREAVAEHHRRDVGAGCSADDVLVGPGSKELMFLLQMVYYGDLVVPTPAWVSYAPQAHIIGHHVRFLQTAAEDGWRLTPEQLQQLCELDPDRPRIVILNYPSNPTGGTYHRDELEALAEVAQRFRVILLSDEIYGKLHHEGEHQSIAPLYPQGTIFSSGLSKWCGAGGWRLGVFVVPRSLRWLLDAMAAVASETFTATSAPIQYAAVTAFQGGDDIEDYLVDCRRILKALGRSLCELLERGGVRTLPPEGAFYLFPDFGGHREALASRGIRTSEELCERLLEDTGVALLPGSSFGRAPGELLARLAYVDFDGAAALEDLARQGAAATVAESFLRRHCGDMLEATERIVDWLGAPPGSA